MIIGVGGDLVDIRRIEAVLGRFGSRFTRRVFTESERYECEGRKTQAASYAKRFSAKESCLKALGTGLRGGVSWQDLCVANLPSGRPVICLTGKALQHLNSLLPPGHEPMIHLTLADDYPVAQAFTVIEARKFA